MDPGRDRHPLRQRAPAVEAAAGEPAPDRRRRRDARLAADPVDRVVDVLARRPRAGGSPTSFRSSTVSGGSLGKRSESTQRRASPARRSRGRRRAHAAGTSRSKYGSPQPTVTPRPPGDRRVVPLELRERALESPPARRARSRPVAAHARGDDLVVERRHEHLHALRRSTTRTPSRRCCSAAAGARVRARSAIAREAVDELVEPRGPGCAGCGARRAPAGASASSRRRRLDQHERAQLALQVRDDLAVGERRRDVLGQRVQRPVVAPREQDVPLIGVLVDRVERRRDPVRARRARGGRRSTGRSACPCRREAQSGSSSVPG